MQYMVQNMQPPAPYMPMPRYLLELPVSSTAKILYTVLLSRALLSAQNPEFQDEQGRVYQYYTIEDLQAALRRGESATLDALSALEKQGLIRRVRQGPGLANRIYVLVQTPENQGPQPWKTTVHNPGKPRRNNKKEYIRNNNNLDPTGGYDTL